jgi:hypothetical protein
MAESTTIRLRFDEATHETVEVIPVGGHRFRLQDTPLSATEPVFAGDVIEVASRPDGTFGFVRVFERAPLRHYSWVVPRGWAASVAHREYVAQVEAVGGTWEQVMGGLLHVHIPNEASFDAEAELDRYLKSDWPEA